MPCIRRLSGINGGFNKHLEINSKSVILLYLEVENIDATLEKIKKNGGKQTQGKTLISPRSAISLCLMTAKEIISVFGHRSDFGGIVKIVRGFDLSNNPITVVGIRPRTATGKFVYLVIRYFMLRQVLTEKESRL